MATRRNSGGCQHCGGGHGNGSGSGRGSGGKTSWWWIIGIAAALLYFSGQNDGDPKDYKSPSSQSTCQGAIFKVDC